MAEFDALDELLSGSLKRAAQPGDSAGVADTIRARVASGDVGTPSPSTGSAPGFGGWLGGWLPWVGAIVVLGLVGATLGVTGVFGHPIDVVTVGTSSILIPPTVQASSCPGGPVVGSVERGSRVVALARSADGAEVQVRNPGDVAQLVWIPVGELVSDSGQTPVAGLPVGPSCPTVTVAQAPVVVTPVTPVTPTKPGKPKDTTAPTEGKPTATFGNCHTTISVTASDNVGVTSVSISWIGTNTGSGAMTQVGGHWEYTTNGFHDGNNTFSVTAHDAAGNASPTGSVTTMLQCLI
jgi:hypothetical protein